MHTRSIEYYQTIEACKNLISSQEPAELSVEADSYLPCQITWHMGNYHVVCSSSVVSVRRSALVNRMLIEINPYKSEKNVHGWISGTRIYMEEIEP